MKTNYNRDWLESYKTNPRKDNSIYKNYQNPSMTKWDTQMGTLSPAQKGRYEQFINTIPDEVRGLSAPDMQRYLQGVNEKQETLGKERAGYDNQIQNIKNQEQARINAQTQQQEVIKQTQLRERQLRERQLKYKNELTGWYKKYDHASSFNHRPDAFRYDIVPSIRAEVNAGIPHEIAVLRFWQRNPIYKNEDEAKRYGLPWPQPNNTSNYMYTPYYNKPYKYHLDTYQHISDYVNDKEKYDYAIKYFNL
jgi:hypothetical protein